MAPAKNRNTHEDSKSDAKDKDKSHGGSSSHQSNGKMRRQASQASHARNEPVAPLTAEKASTAATQEPVTVQWNLLHRDVLHAYRREHRLAVPKSYANSYHHYVFNQVGTIGLLSPTMARRKEHRLQTKEQLAMAVRKHFNSMGVTENDVIVDLLHSAHHKGVRTPKTRLEDKPVTEADR